MRFESSPQVSKAIAILFGTVAFVFFYFALFVAIGIAAMVLLLIALFAVLMAIASAMARYTVRLDKDKAAIEKHFKTLMIDRTDRYPLSRYRGVGVGTGGRGGVGAPTLVYFVELIGPRNLRITAASGDRSQAERDARAVSEATSLPLMD